MLPFRISLLAGEPAYAQVVYAVTRAIVSGQLRPGDAFPSVRLLSQELGINPNTAAKAVAALRDAGLVETRPGTGTVVATVPAASTRERQGLLREELERLVVEAKRLGLTVDDVADALRGHWKRLEEE